MGRDFGIPAREREFIARVEPEDIAVVASDANGGVTADDRDAKRPGRPPAPHELRLSPGVEHDPFRSVEGVRNDDLAIALELHRRLLQRRDLTFLSCDHRTSPFL